MLLISKVHSTIQNAILVILMWLTTPFQFLIKNKAQKPEPEKKTECLRQNIPLKTDVLSLRFPLKCSYYILHQLYFICLSVYVS